MKAKKRNGFLTFIFSFMPGCAEMYWGYMQMGMSLLLPFMLIIAVAALIRMEELIFLDAIVYIYAFFHARNMAHMSEEEVSMLEDEPVHILKGIAKPMDLIKNKNMAIGAGVLLIIFGVYRLLENVYLNVSMSDAENRFFRFLLDAIPQWVASIAVILLGVWLIKGKKSELDAQAAMESNLIEDKGV